MARIQLRRDTAANWTAANPTLASGEKGIETDTGKEKTGNGTTAWNTLTYLSAAAGPHRASHEPGGTDALTVDAAAATGSLRTLGTTATSATAGNDARLSDARTPTAHRATHGVGGSDALTTADLASGTANATTFLRGDRTWAAPAGGGGGMALGGGRAGFYFGPPMALTTGSYQPASGRIMAAPIALQACTVDRFAVRVVSTTAGAGSVVRVGIYNDNEGTPGSLLAELGTIPVTATGVQEIVTAQAVTAGVYWLAVLSEVASGAAALAVYADTAPFPYVHSSESATNALTYGLQGYVATIATGALPASYPAAATASSGGVNASIVRTA